MQRVCWNKWSKVVSYLPCSLTVTAKSWSLPGIHEAAASHRRRYAAVQAGGCDYLQGGGPYHRPRRQHRPSRRVQDFRPPLEDWCGLSAGGRNSGLAMVQARDLRVQCRRVSVPLDSFTQGLVLELWEAKRVRSHSGLCALVLQACVGFKAPFHRFETSFISSDFVGYYCDLLIR